MQLTVNGDHIEKFGRFENLKMAILSLTETMPDRYFV